MKAIQIFAINKDLLEAWGESEELTWENSFKNLIGSVLVVDDYFPQGYACQTHDTFYETYTWASNFGTRGWSEIKRIEPVEEDCLTDEEIASRAEALRAAIVALPQHHKVLTEMLAEVSD